MICKKGTKERIISMFEEIVTNNEVKFNDLEKDEKLKLNADGNLSKNLVEKVVEVVPITDSYRKAETVIEETTCTSLSHEKIRSIIVKIGDKITSKEKEERKLFDKKQCLVNKQYIAGIMKPKEISKLRDARVFSQYDISKIKWTKENEN